nr:MAG TPA: hypothetical protein [Caudoviricetes sp.]
MLKSKECVVTPNALAGITLISLYLLPLGSFMEDLNYDIISFLIRVYQQGFLP